jgi:hypothetical protein
LHYGDHSPAALWRLLAGRRIPTLGFSTHHGKASAICLPNRESSALRPSATPPTCRGPSASPLSQPPALCRACGCVIALTSWR